MYLISSRIISYSLYFILSFKNLEVVVKEIKLLCCKDLDGEPIIQLPTPFSFPNFFNQKMKKNKLKVQFKFFRVFSSIDINISYPVKFINCDTNKFLLNKVIIYL
jgi:hypothetical protein